MVREKIVIDPGHGGSDPGTLYGKYMEKDLVLDISLKLEKELVKRGYDVLLTRTKDVGLSSVTRAKIVRDSGTVLCLSNHINAGGGTGTEIIQSIHSDGVFASILLDSISQTGMKKRRIFSRESNIYPGKDYYYMLRDTKPVETVLIEYGFIDNEADRRKLVLQSFRQELALAVANGVDKYLYSEETPNVIDDMPVVIIDLHGQKKSFPPDKKQIIDNRWYLEARTLTEMAGGKVVWDDVNKKAVFDFSNK